jgi:hypothetical protein
MSQVVQAAAAEDPVAVSRQRLQQILPLADRFGLSRWQLVMRYAEVLLLDASCPSDCIQVSHV